MNIQIGISYQITNKFKKSYMEREILRKNNWGCGDIITYSIWYRSGRYIITPTSEEEVKLLTDAMQDNFAMDLDLADFTEAEFLDANDGSSDDWDFDDVDSMDGEELETFQEEAQEEGLDWLEDNGWVCVEQECFFTSPITVTEYIEGVEE